MKYLAITFSFLFFISCSVEEPTKQYTTAIRNTSNQPLHVLILGNGENKNTPVYDTLVNKILNKGEVVFKNTYRAPNFLGMHNGVYIIDIYYTEFIFNNNIGYICAEGNEENSLCFSNKVSLTKSYSEADFTLENGIYYYDITQEDYENAYELP